MRKLKKPLEENLKILEQDYINAVDYTAVKLSVGGVNTAVISLDGQIDKQYLSIGVLSQLSDMKVDECIVDLLEFIKTKVLAVCEQVDILSIEDINEKIMLGFAVVLVDGYDKGVCFGVQGYQFRSVAQPENETMLRGSKEGFVEPILINMSLIRRRLRTTQLKFERMFIGEESNTPILICYLQNRVSKEILDKIKLQLKDIPLKTVMAEGYLPGFLNKKGIFGNAGVTERPDTVCGKIEEGRVAVIIDGTPSVLIMPYLFVENFQSLDDYASKPVYASYMRYIKYIAFFIALFLPALYVAIVSVRPELMSDSILIKLAEEESKTPFTVFWEVIFVNMLYEIMREAALRAPKVLSQAVSIVGALVIGDMAVSSGLIGAPSLIVIALSAISGYAVPKLYEQLAILRFALIFIGGILGVWGLMCSAMFILINICAANSFGIPVTAPMAPFMYKFMRDVWVRATWKKLNQDRSTVQEMRD